jgi:hypothetical protein
MSQIRAYREVTEELLKYPQVKDVVTKVGPSVLGAAASTVNPALGSATSVGATTLAATNPDGFAKFTTGLGVCAAGSVLSIVATPVFVGWLAWEGIKAVFGRD